LSSVNVIVTGTKPTVSFATLNSTVFSVSCLPCHNATTASGGYNMSTYTGVVTAVQSGNAPASMLFLQVFNNTMPPGGPPVSAANVEAIQNWINEGAPNN
jgi:hypothetical protein